MKLAALLLVAAAAFGQNYDVVVYGGTPGGISAAIAAARMGRTVALIEYHNHVGGMSASGLGKSDIETREAIGGMFAEFVGRVYRHYEGRYGKDSENVKLSQDGYYYEPHVAERIFEEMLAAEKKISVFKRYRLREVMRHGRRVTGLRAENRSSGRMQEFRAKIFIDATYEGDLAAYAGARYRTGRESRKEFNELHAGVVYQDPRTRTFLAGTTGEGDDRLQAYTFRLCLTDDPSNSYVLREPPPGYDRALYLPYLEDWKAGRLDSPGSTRPGNNTVLRAFTIAAIPNRKYDANMYPRVLAYPFVEVNRGYPDADWEEREKITERIRNITLGLLYFVQNDPDVPDDHKAIARRFHLAKDEFQDNRHFPWQLYVREARRIVGMYTLSENDVTLAPGLGRTPVHEDSIMAGEFPIDSMPVRRRQPGDDTILEGYLLMLDNITRPYQIPYRIMVPEETDGLLVPVPASTTHIAFSSVRLEPTWMGLGHAAGLAAHLAIEGGVQPRGISVETLQRLLLRQGQILTYFRDLNPKEKAHQAIQYFGTKGFFPDYSAKSSELLDEKTAKEWIKRAGVDLPVPSSPITRGDFCQMLFGERKP